MKNVTKTNALFAFIVVFYLFCSYLISVLGAFDINIPQYVLQFLPHVILLIPCLVYIVWMKPETVKDISYGAVSAGTVLKIIVLTYLLMPTMTFINGVSSMFVENKVVEALDVVFRYPLWFRLLTMALIPAVVEEFICRGLIFHGLKKRNPFWAVIISALFFGVLHMNINQFLYAFAMGVFFALITYATNSMWPSMLMHFIYNAQSVILSHLLMTYASDMMEVSETVATEEINTAAMIVAYLMVYGTLFVIAIVGLVLAVLLYLNISKKNRGEESVKRIFKKPFRTTFDESQGKFIDGYFILAVGLCVLHMILTEIG